MIVCFGIDFGRLKFVIRKKQRPKRPIAYLFGEAIVIAAERTRELDALNESRDMMFLACDFQRRFRFLEPGLLPEI